MSRLRITNPGQADGVVSSWGTVIELDGHEVRHVRSVHVSASFDRAVTATVELFASDDLAVELNADVIVTIQPENERFDIEETALDNGRKLYRSVLR